MALPKLPARIECACGAVHTCDIKSVVCGKNAVAAVPELLAEQRALVLVTDGNTAPLAGDALAAALCHAHSGTSALAELYNHPTTMRGKIQY